MKSSAYLFIVAAVLMFCQCKDERIFPCEDIRSGLLNYDVGLAKPEIDEMLEDLQPAPVTNDLTGHEDNLEQFVERLMENCGFISAIECYACIETLPALSEVAVSLDSSGVLVNRTLDILTPEDTVMTLRSIHK